MIATDGIYFTSPHPGLTVSSQLGEWEEKPHAGLTLFKPGVYWDNEARARIAAGQAVAFKARGISARDFASEIGTVDEIFAGWEHGDTAWPRVEFRSRFSQYSVLQAVQWSQKRPGTYQRYAGVVTEGEKLVQSSDPRVKRRADTLYRDDTGVWRTLPYRQNWPGMDESAPYQRHFGYNPDERDFNELMTPDGPLNLSFIDALGVG
jgi:hypothetical protein